MIVLFTDFGLAGPYTGQVQAVLHQSAPGVPIISLFANAPAEQPKLAAYLLAAYGTWFPPGTVLLCVIDPGVGSERRAVVVEAEGRTYVGPDNGLFDIVMRRAAEPRLWEIIWHPGPLSPSFHGRDLFAPVAARLALGESVAGFAQPADDRSADRGWPDDLGEIVYIDHYGNAMTGLRGALLAPDARLLAAGRSLARAATFSAVPHGEAFWYINSNGLAEIAVNGGRAAETLGLAVGDHVRIEA
ncbi:MAG: SAM-dependent chlorinase/fluorinase [Alphaproteobacteria bacterium]|nr:SAM-dependent chlorinase/fluorinase [Alphaproteobacteria bacterium]